MKNFKIIIIACLLSLPFIATAQRQSDQIYFSNLPQASRYNPAMHGYNRFYLNVPALGKVDFNFNTSGFCWRDLINQHPQYKDSLQIDIEGFVNKLKDNNYFDLGLTENILGFGFVLGKHHFSFDLSLNVESRLNFSNGLFNFIAYGTEAPGNMANLFNRELIDFNTYLSTALGYSLEFNDKLTVGMNAKMYLGLANINTERANIGLDFSNNKVKLNGDIAINTSNAITDWQIVGNLFNGGSIEMGGFSMDNIKEAFKNKGFGVDLGATYWLMDNLQLSLSVVDLGFINWKANSTRLQSKHPNTQVEFGGIHTSYGSINEDLSDYMQEMADTLMYVFDLETQQNAGYTAWVPTKIYLGGSYEFAKFNYVNALYKGYIISGVYQNSLMLSYSFKSRWFQLSVGNTFSSKWLNPNLLISFADWIYVGAGFASSVNAADASGLSVYFGLNTVLKQNKEKRNKKPSTSKAKPSTSPVESKNPKIEPEKQSS